MLFATNRIPKEGVKTAVDRKVSFDPQNVTASQSMFFCERKLKYNICAQESSPKEAIENFGELIGYEHAPVEHLGKSLRDCVFEVPLHNGFFNASNSKETRVVGLEIEGYSGQPSKDNATATLHNSKRSFYRIRGEYFHPVLRNGTRTHSSVKTLWQKISNTDLRNCKNT